MNDIFVLVVVVLATVGAFAVGGLIGWFSVDVMRKVFGGKR